MLTWPQLLMAMEITLFDKQLDPSQFDKGQSRSSCRQVFARPPFGAIIMRAVPDGTRTREFNIYHQGQRPPETIQAVENILQQWEKSGHYTPDNIKFLRNMDRSLEPMRTKYITIEHGGHLSGIRVFDGSTAVYNHGYKWLGIPDGKAARAPLEKLYDYQLPERADPKGAYVWEFGLLGSPEHFIKGVEAVFSHIAYILDSHYNGYEYAVFGRTNQIEAMSFQIYGLARPKLAGHYAKYGFHPVILIDSKGVASPVQFPDGMRLVKISGVDFLKRHFYNSAHPATPDGHKLEDVAKVQDTIEWMQKRNRELDEYPPPKIDSWQQFLGTYSQIVRMYSQQYYQNSAGSGARQDAFFNLVGTLHVLFKAPIVDQYDSNSPMKRRLIKELMIEGPEYGMSVFEKYFLHQQ